MKAIVFKEFGEPADVLQLQDLSVPEPGRGQVRVRMIASPINPSDLLVVRGQYGRLPELPATPGFEGVGVVEAAGPGLLGKFRVGKRVAVLNGITGNWQEQVIVPARQVVPVARDIPDEQAASFFVNPATALVMTRWVLRIPRGAWLLQTAAASALGRMIIRLGKHDGFRTINIVRRRELAEELRREGSYAVIIHPDESIQDAVQSITKGAGVQYALDAVGGATAVEVIKALGQGGRLLVYGTLASEPMTLDSRMLMVGHRCVEGFWLSNWVKDQGILTMLRLFRTINRLVGQGVLRTPIGPTFKLDEIRAAVQAAGAASKPGKVLLRMGK